MGINGIGVSWYVTLIAPAKRRNDLLTLPFVGRTREVFMPFDGLAFSLLEPRLEWPDPLRATSISSRSRPASAGTLAVLLYARKLIAEERRWCRHSFARSWFGIPVPAHSRLARRYCALGAIKRAGSDLGLPFGAAAARLQEQAGRQVPTWNDHPRRSHAEVLAAFDAAIGAARGV